jgi:hypothetical protein
LDFPDGHVVLPTRLCEGQCATVFQLPATPHTVVAREVAGRVVRGRSVLT